MAKQDFITIMVTGGRTYTVNVTGETKTGDDMTLKAQWITEANKQTIDFEPGLMFWGSHNAVFNKSDPLRAALVSERNDLQADMEVCLLITGFELPRPGNPVWDKIFVPEKHLRGSREAGSLRAVYNHVGEDSGLNIRAGLTVHEGNGSWSSWPAHEFETQALMAPAQLFPEFHEVFAYLTEPANMWGVQVAAPPNADTRYEACINVVRDRDIQRIVLGAHPVVAAPGVRLAYLWAYVGGWEKF